MKITITDESLDYLAALSRLSVPEGERETLKRELQSLLDYMELLDALPETELQIQGQGRETLRGDEVTPSYPVEAITLNGAAVRGGAFQVPQTVE
ncbi:MAG: Asp-tRNA(Asn)/Glu-tRNA(Gln) amidotransferase subunit GatC [Christensenellaceae bacterium]|jgi:aspartyl-tRNA(Asn)/glutamyl-tRNA(Gln) amidotransferase subunit C|nr:Asp-tRNA(Asn)/Glu-tRNA(Gln) amidotransferase subunit GatC [Christensenellaceae bacterium]